MTTSTKIELEHISRKELINHIQQGYRQWICSDTIYPRCGMNGPEVKNKLGGVKLLQRTGLWGYLDKGSEWKAPFFAPTKARVDGRVKDLLSGLVSVRSTKYLHHYKIEPTFKDGVMNDWVRVTVVPRKRSMSVEAIRDLPENDLLLRDPLLFNSVYFERPGSRTRFIMSGDATEKRFKGLAFKLAEMCFLKSFLSPGCELDFTKPVSPEKDMWYKYGNYRVYYIAKQKEWRVWEGKS